MSQQVRVERELVFDNQAEIATNIKGNPSTERMCVVDWFNGKAIDTTNDYTGAAGSALTGAGYNGLTLTTSATDNVIYYFATPLIFDITQKPEIEIRLKLSDVSGTIIFFGFSDAVSETSPAATIDADGGTLYNAATDAVGFVIDADLGTSSIYCASVNNQSAGGTVQSVDTAIDWEDDESRTLRVKLDASGNAYLYADGKEVGYIALAVADVPLCAIINFGTRDDDGANPAYVRYLKMWQDIP